MLPRVAFICFVTFVIQVSADGGTMKLPKSNTNTLQVAVPYDVCYSMIPTDVTVTVQGHHTFSATMVTKHIWGFYVDVTRIGSNGGWGKNKGDVTWTLSFGSNSDYLDDSCLNGGTCSNQEGGKVCGCLAGFFGPNCDADGGVEPIPQSSSNTKRITVLYEKCYNVIPTTIILTAEGQHTFSATMVTKHIWGFYADVTRMDSNGGWGNNKGDVTWTLSFGSNTDYLDDSCLNGGTCSNQEGGKVCGCFAGFFGPNCDADGGVAPIPQSSSNTKRITVLYEKCYNVSPTTIILTAEGQHTFSATMVTKHIWGFYADVTRTDSNGGWGNNKGDVTWTVSFDNNNNTADDFCQNGATCANNEGGKTCTCTAGFVGADCSANDYCAAVTVPCSNNGQCINEPTTFTCNCLPGYAGSDCSIDIDDCITQPCLNNGICTDLVNDYTCICQGEYTGKDCEIEVTGCSESSPCGGNAVCLNTTNGFACACLPGYSGANCLTDIDDCITQPCVNNGICMDLVNDYNCTCQHGYAGKDCEIVPLQCRTPDCGKWAECVITNERFTCQCKENFEGDGFTCISFCPRQNFWSEDLNTTLTFPKTPVDNTVTSTQLCPDGRPLASRDCFHKEGSDEAIFGELYHVDCDITVDNILKQVKEGVEDKGTSFSLATLKLVTRSKLDEEQVETVIEGIKYINNYIAKNQKKISVTAMYDSMQITESLTKQLQTSEQTECGEPNLKQQLFQTLQNLSLHVQLEEDKEIEILSTDNIALQINKPFKSDHYEAMTFAPFNLNQTWDGKPRVSVTIPESVVNEAAEDVDDDLYVRFLYFNNDDLFASSQDAQFVVSASIKDYEPKTKKNLLRVSYYTNEEQGAVELDDNKLKELVTRTQCSTWDEKHDRWIPNGCRLVKHSSPPECECYKLTNFAMLIDSKILPSSFAIGIFTYVGMGISAVCLVATAAIYTSVRTLRERKPTSFLLNICFCLFMVNVIFLAGSNQVQNMIPCYVTTALLHYFLLASWVWMTANACNMYRALVTVLGSSGDNLVCWCVAGYFLPLIVVSVNSGVAIFGNDLHAYRPDNIMFESAYKARHMCWLRLYSLYFGFLLPVGILTLINFVLFVVILRKITNQSLKIQSNVKERGTKGNFMIAIAMSFMLGLNWVFGFLMLLADNVAYQEIMAWLFTIFNSTQGISIFLLNCVRQSAVRKLWCRCGKKSKQEQRTTVGQSNTTTTNY